MYLRILERTDVRRSLRKDNEVTIFTDEPSNLRGFTAIDGFTLIVASWVIRAMWREIQRFELVFKTSQFFLNSYIDAFFFKRVSYVQ